MRLFGFVLFFLAVVGMSMVIWWLYLDLRGVTIEAGPWVVVAPVLSILAIALLCSRLLVDSAKRYSESPRGNSLASPYGNIVERLFYSRGGGPVGVAELVKALDGKSPEDVRAILHALGCKEVDQDRWVHPGVRKLLEQKV